MPAKTRSRDPRIDAYIARSPEFAQPILTRIRQVVHQACPRVEETMKWSSPHFLYKGMMCGMAAFKQHCAFGFWKGSLILGQGGRSAEAMGQFGRLTHTSDLPSTKVLAGYVKKAMALNDAGIKTPTARKTGKKKPLRVPADLAAALAKNNRARSAFDGFPPSYKREYLEWITEAKTEATRQRRLETAVAWMADGKSRNWKYMDSR